MTDAASFYEAMEGDGIFLLGGVTVRGHDMIDGDSFAILVGATIRAFGRFKSPLAADGVYCAPGETIVVSRRYYERVISGRLYAKLLPLAEGVILSDADRWRDLT